MTASPPRSQPIPEDTRRLINGEFYAKNDKIFRAPIETKTETGTNISVGFPVCHVSDYVDPQNLVECLNASREVDGLTARIDEQQKVCDSYAEENQRFHDRIEELESRTSLVTFNEACKRIEELEEWIAMARTRCNAALMGDEPCKPCIELAISYLDEALPPSSGGADR